MHSHQSTLRHQLPWRIIVLAMASVIWAVGLFTYWHIALVVHAARAHRNLHRRMLNGLLAAPLRFFSQHTNGELLNRYAMPLARFWLLTAQCSFSSDTHLAENEFGINCELYATLANFELTQSSVTLSRIDGQLLDSDRVSKRISHELLRLDATQLLDLYFSLLAYLDRSSTCYSKSS